MHQILLQDSPVPNVEPMDIIDTLKPYDEKNLSR